MAEINSQHFHSFKSPLLGKRRSLLLWITLITLICGALIGLKPDSLINGNFKLASDFFKASLSPAIEYENPVTGAEPFLKTVFNSLTATLKFAILAIYTRRTNSKYSEIFGELKVNKNLLLDKGL